ncbi:MAG: acylphosphatase [Candidatus Bipolaricaulota bacterium]|nr:acylphosphatase [Candidatus Bipolaricaulota bacterium]
MAKARAIVRITGEVQGVGFRNFTVRKARPLGLSGYVQNLRDGSVRAEIEGERDHIEKLLEILKSEGPGQVEHIEVIWSDYLDEFTGFGIQM